MIQLPPYGQDIFRAPYPKEKRQPLRANCAVNGCRLQKRTLLPRRWHGILIPIERPEIIQSGICSMTICKADIYPFGHRPYRVAHSCVAGQRRSIAMTHHKAPPHTIVSRRIIPRLISLIVWKPLTLIIRNAALKWPKIGPIGIHKYRCFRRVRHCDR